jgi:hypothetical protein
MVTYELGQNIVSYFNRRGRETSSCICFNIVCECYVGLFILGYIIAIDLKWYRFLLEQLKLYDSI